jgi:16S rRNA A1518/A1519 N6-dimethyltransferase RsmA/KsgA/DIM1 with predicted DNA glycosylase/AP lyase activity
MGCGDSSCRSFRWEDVVTALHNRRIAYSQNFLRSPWLVDRLLERSSISAGELVVEVGPGRGVITERLAARCRQVLAVEKDPVMVERLRVRFADTPNVALFAADFLASRCRSRPTRCSPISRSTSRRRSSAG